MSKSILITGGTGSAGHALTKRLLQNEATERVVIFSRDEVKQAEMRENFTDPRMRFFIGDVRDRDRLRRAFEGVDTVFHAAALKRIEVGHYNPAEMVKTNVLGSMNVIEAAHDAGVSSVIALSTDKACEPISAYGQSKALAETLFLAANNTRGAHGPKFTVTRYGNVAFSRGSVIPKWLAMGDTVPVTDPDATRFYMTMEQAVNLIMYAADHMLPEIITTTLPAYRLGDLAEALGKKTIVHGMPHWEKMHESMVIGATSEHARRMSVDEIREAVAAGLREAA